MFVLDLFHKWHLKRPKRMHSEVMKLRRQHHQNHQWYLSLHQNQPNQRHFLELSLQKDRWYRDWWNWKVKSGWCDLMWFGSQIFFAMCPSRTYGKNEKTHTKTKLLKFSTIPGNWCKSWCNHWKLLSPTSVSKTRFASGSTCIFLILEFGGRFVSRTKVTKVVKWKALKFGGESTRKKIMQCQLVSLGEKATKFAVYDLALVKLFLLEFCGPKLSLFSILFHTSLFRGNVVFPISYPFAAQNINGSRFPMVSKKPMSW